MDRDDARWRGAAEGSPFRLEELEAWREARDTARGRLEPLLSVASPAARAILERALRYDREERDAREEAEIAARFNFGARSKSMSWPKTNIAGVHELKWIHEHDDKPGGRAIEVVVRKYVGKDITRSALVLAGVHGSEPEGVKAAEVLRCLLDNAYQNGKKAGLTVLLITDLFARADTDDARYVCGVDPNRNFPLAGESYATAYKRGQSGGPELLDPDQRGFPNMAPQGDPKDTWLKGRSKTMLTETRILLKLIGWEKPTRAVSIHSHQGRERSNGPGVFVDPRGGFDSVLDAALTAEGRADDELTDQLLKAAVKRIDNKIATSGKADKEVLEKLKEVAFAGNQLKKQWTVTRGKDGCVAVAGETVHYAYSAPKPRGTSFGMWGPAPISEGGAEDRAGITTLTLELPNYGKTDSRTQEIATIWAAAIADKFLEGGNDLVDGLDQCRAAVWPK